MRKEVLNLLLSDKIRFSKYGDKLKGFIYPPVLGDFFGEDKVDIANQIIKKMNSNKAKVRKYFKLPTLDEIINHFRYSQSSLKSKSYTIRTQNDENDWQFSMDTVEYSKKDILWKIYCEDYIEKIALENEPFTFICKRNSKEVDMLFWNKYKKYIKEFEEKTKTW